PARGTLGRALGRRARAVIAGSGEEKSALIRIGVPRTHIAVVPYGVDTERFHRQGVTASRGTTKRLVHVGPLSPERGALTIVRALQGLPDVELVLAGGPTPEELHDDLDAQRLRELAEQLGVASRVTLLGQVKRAAVPKLMRSADAVVTVPREAPTGIVALEAMACGVPVIASSVGAHLDSVIDGVTGLLVPPDRPSRTARLARELLTDPTLRTAPGGAAAGRARSRCSWERVSQGRVRVYEAACASHHPAGGPATDPVAGPSAAPFPGLPVEPLLRGRGRSSRGSAEAGRFESEVEGEAVVAVGEVAAGEAAGLAEPVVEGLAVDAERGGGLLGVAAEVQVDLAGLGQLRVQARHRLGQLAQVAAAEPGQQPVRAQLLPAGDRSVAGEVLRHAQRLTGLPPAQPGVRRVGPGAADARRRPVRLLDDPGDLVGQVGGGEQGDRRAGAGEHPARQRPQGGGALRRLAHR